MAKASPAFRSFNAGEFSVLMEGRTDIDRYPASLRELHNFITTPQGPVVRRSGTLHIAQTHAKDTPSALIPFVFSKQQALALEFSAGVMRVITQTGVQTYAPTSCTVIAHAPLRLNAPTLSAEVGDSVALSGLPPVVASEGLVVKITAKSGVNYTLDVTFDDAPYASYSPSVAKVYAVQSPYGADDVLNIRSLQSADVLYLFCDGKQPYTLSRYGATDWRLTALEFKDGPYMDANDKGVSLKPSSTANRISSDKVTPWPFGYTEAHPAAHAFDSDQKTFWESANAQIGGLEFQANEPFACDGYVVFVARDNSNTLYTNKEMAPGDWVLDGSTNNGVTWQTIDSQNGYVLYDGMRSAYFKLNNATVFNRYRFQISACMRNGAIQPRIGQLAMTSAASSVITLTASGTAGINNDAGFKSTDVGRLIRAKASDGFWRPFRITAVNSATVVTAKLEGDPLPNTEPMLEWRLGYWSDTTGWPTCGCFFEDRLWLGGSADAPDLICGSITGGYDTFAQSNSLGEVLDESAVVVRLTSRELGRVHWIANDERGLLIGTSSGEWVLNSGSSGTDAITATALRARQSTARGSADAEAVKVDRQVLYVQRSRRHIREFAYVYSEDGYRAPSMSQFASHMGASYFEQMAYAAEPHSVVWVRRGDGSIAGLTYNRDENVIGWHTHDFGGVVESICVLPTEDQRQDALWLSINRDGVRSIERMANFWDFGSTLLGDAHYVDNGLRYSGVEIETVYGLRHLEGRPVVGLVDGVPFDERIVLNGAIDLPVPASNVVVGLPFESRLRTSRLEAGAADGTAQGKVKRINSLVVSVWDSAGGEVGVTVQGDARYEPIPYSEAPYEVVDSIALQTGMLGPVVPAGGYDMDGVVVLRQPGASPLPLNVISILPQVNTQDR